MDLTEKQWQVIAPLLPKEKVREDGRRRPWRDPRDVLNGILWILRTGAPWADLPERYPPRATCHRRFQKWCQDGTMSNIRTALLEDLEKRGKIDFKESFIDGSFASAKKGGPAVGKTKRGKGTKWMAVVDGNGLPLGVTIHSASLAEVRLVDEVIDNIPLKKLPERLIGDKAYDSDKLALDLWETHNIELIAPNRSNRRKSQDGRPLRRYRKRWKVERFFAWLGNFRRIVVRWEYHSKNYLGFIELACAIILLRYL
ncbi:MAG: IS5 family transposase [Myxococcota bacterium]|nr:IS5 family transposase [Myxococcota bacterium]